MKTTQLDVPLMYGDHHVLAVRQLLNTLPGVSKIYASSSFQIVEVEYDSSQTSEADIQSILAKEGYLEELSIPAERGSPGEPAAKDGQPYFRHTAVFNQTGTTIGFGQSLPKVERPLWPCPGINR